jgi:pilus assembly protein CpaE
MENFRIAVAAPHSKELAHLVATAKQAQPDATVTSLAGGVEQLLKLPAQPAPDLLIVECVHDSKEELAPIERLSLLYPQLTFIVLAKHQSSEFLLHAMRIGVREVLPSPASADMLHMAISRLREKMSTQARKNGTVLAFISCKGGSGATFLAANLAHALSLSEGKKVALLDLNLQFGDASLFVSEQKPTSTLADLAHDIQRLDATLLAGSMISVTPNFSLLAAPEDPAQGMEVKPEHIEALIKLARNHYDFVVLDLGHSLDATTIKALDQADVVFPVLQLTLPYIRDGKRLLNIFNSLGYPRNKISLIVNRYEKGSEIKLEDLEQVMGTKVARIIPNHYAVVAASVNQGMPVIKLNRNSPVSKALLEMSQELSQEPTHDNAGWLSRIFKRA